MQLPEGTAIILFADIVDSTALTEQLGDAVFRARASSLDAAIRAGIRDCGGTPIEGKVMGDGVMAVFGAARQAIDGRLPLPRGGRRHGARAAPGHPRRRRDARRGERVRRGGEHRVAHLRSVGERRDPGVGDGAGAGADVGRRAAFEDRGEHQLKGIADAVRVYAVRQGSG